MADRFAPLELIALVAAVILFKLWARNKEARDPEFAARVERARVRMQGSQTPWGLSYLLNRAFWVVGAIGVVAVNAAVEKYAPMLHWSDQQKMTVFLAAAVLVVVLAVIADRVLMRWLRARAFIRS